MFSGVSGFEANFRRMAELVCSHISSIFRLGRIRDSLNEYREIGLRGDPVQLNPLTLHELQKATFRAFPRKSRHHVVMRFCFGATPCHTPLALENYNFQTVTSVTNLKELCKIEMEVHGLFICPPAGDITDTLKDLVLQYSVAKLHRHGLGTGGLVRKP